MKSNTFVNNEYYHIYCRGVEKRQIFMDDTYYRRFLLGLKVFNTESLSWISEQKDTDERFPRQDNLVNILCYCLMPNHYHLLLKQKIDGGITKFMRKLNTGFTMYFNLKNERTGRLFESRFKSVHVEDNEYLMHLWRYIHLNPLDLINKNWREGKFKNSSFIKFLTDYKWSSYKYFNTNIRNDIINKDIFEELYDKNLDNSLVEWSQRDTETLGHLTLES